MMKSFKASLEKKIKNSLSNNYGIENYDENRFGAYRENEIAVNDAKKPGLKFLILLKSLVKKIIRYKSNFIADSYVSLIGNYSDKLQFIWEQMNQEGKELLVDIVAYRLLGYQKIKLPTNNAKYWEALEKAKGLKNITETYDPHFLHFILYKFDLRDIGYNVKLYFRDSGIAIAFINEQYAYKIGTEYIVSASENDVVFDIGACWGDTALYFADKTGEKGKVYSFEFIPENIKLFEINRGLNPPLIDQIELVKHPVSNISGQTIFFKDNGPGSRVEANAFEGQTGTTTTLSIDDFVHQKGLSKVDFIKMDIEGAEPKALEGAIETIKKFKPKLAIAIYHSIDDLTNIPVWISSLNLGYKIYIGHYTIHAEETVLFATC
jgi:FkbM family methyltransferase